MECICCGGLMGHEGEVNGFRHARCRNCQYEQFSVEGGAISHQLYEDDADYEADLAISDDHRSLLQWNHHKALKFIQANCRAGASILDVGCFNGFFVKELIARKFDAYGIDFNEKAIEIGQKRYGLNDRISTQSVEELIVNGQAFDVITLFEVIEHLPSFHKLLELLCQCLVPGGILVISTPNANMSWRPPLDSPPHHLSRFTPGSLRHLVVGLGLREVASFEQSSTFDLFRNYIGLFFRAGRNTSLRGGKFRMPRFVGALRRAANFFKGYIYMALYPVDRVLAKVGFRYISQVVIARRDS